MFVAGTLIHSRQKKNYKNNPKTNAPQTKINRNYQRQNPYENTSNKTSPRKSLLPPNANTRNTKRATAGGAGGGSLGGERLSPRKTLKA